MGWDIIDRVGFGSVLCGWDIAQGGCFGVGFCWLGEGVGCVVGLWRRVV